MSAPRAHEISSDLLLEIERDSVVALCVAVSRHAGAVQREELVAADGDGRRVELVEIEAEHGGRVHVVDAAAGTLHVSYRAALQQAGRPGERSPRSLDIETIDALRPSRYCPSDRMAGFAATTFAPDGSAAGRARAIASWVFEHIALLPGSSDVSDSAVDTLLLGAGVCRDFAHLTITLCRALGVPARFVSVYAPGLTPMEMHAVVEVETEHGWEVIDATRRAPRSSLVRVATGRDAADAAFVTTVSGSVGLLSVDVMATIDDDLPADDHESVCVLA